MSRIVIYVVALSSRVRFQGSFHMYRLSEFGEMRESQIVQQTVPSLSHQNETQTIWFVTKMVFTYTISQYLLPQFLSRPI